MFRYIVVLTLTLAALPAWAFNEDYQDGGWILRNSTSQDQTATGLRHMANSALQSGHPDGPFVAHLLQVQALPRGLGHAIDRLISTARTPTQMSPRAYRDAISPLLLEMVNLFQADGGDLDKVIKMAKSLAALDKAATSAGLPGIDKIISQTFGKSPMGGRIGKFFAALLEIGKTPDSPASLAELREQRKAKADALIGLLTPRMAPYGPLTAPVRDIMLWTAGSFDRSSQIMDLVSDAIRTGEFDDASYAEQRDGLYEHISRGPWDNETMREALLGWCSAIPQLGSFCTDVFREVKDLFNGPICGVINCDCDNVDKRLFYTEYRKQCLKYELEAQLKCAINQSVVQGCGFPYGPAASPKD